VIPRFRKQLSSQINAGPKIPGQISPAPWFSVPVQNHPLIFAQLTKAEGSKTSDVQISRNVENFTAWLI
jgi:hypothetical protein